MRRDVYGDGVAERQEAERLLRLDSEAVEKCVEWQEFFIEAVTDYVLHKEMPDGYVSNETANWLINAISSDGQINTETELELLVHIMERARLAPASLSSFALQQVAKAVLDGTGPLARGELEVGRINKAEVDLLRRILYASGGGDVGITREEAEMLFMLNNNSIHVQNDPSWGDLFVKAIANSLLCATRAGAPSYEDARKREAKLNEPYKGSAGGMLGQVATGLKSIFGDAGSDSEADAAEMNARYEREIRQAERVEAVEAKWLAERIGADGVLHENEIALLRFISRESPDIHADLKPLLEKIG